MRAFGLTEDRVRSTEQLRIADDCAYHRAVIGRSLIWGVFGDILRKTATDEGGRLSHNSL